MNPRLSICIPTYNFGRFIGETLGSIAAQAPDDVEIVVLDSASTDNTEEVVRGFQETLPGMRYYRAEKKGGIDRDMAKVVELARGEYCWLFSADDLMIPGALKNILDRISTGADVYLCGLTLCTFDMRPVKDHPVLDLTLEREFDLRMAKDREDYFRLARTTTAFFSFMSSLVVRKSRWDAAIVDESFYGSCWAHVARIFGMIPGGLRVRYLPEPYLDKRDDNDSFSERGIAHRVGIAIDGYSRLANAFFGKGSMEEFHIRRVLKNEYPLLDLLYVKLRTVEGKRPGDREFLDGLVEKLYMDGPPGDRLRLLFFRISPPFALKPAEKIYKLLRKYLPLP